MKQIFIVFILCLFLYSCKAKDIIDFVNDDSSIVGDDLPYGGNAPANARPANQNINNSSFYVPRKPVDPAFAANLYNNQAVFPYYFSKPRNKQMGGIYANVSNLSYKPQSYWYTGPRKNKVLEKAKAVNDKNKRKFISNIGIKIAETNEKIEGQKKALNMLTKKVSSGQKVSKDESRWLKDLAAIYKINDFNMRNRDSLNELNTRVDIVPESLAIAQAAVESAWGKSRFATQGNNYFGQWCFEKGCGMVPKQRDEGKSHEVKVFSDPASAVEAYIHNLNTNDAYTKFRIARKNMGTRISGVELANYLTRYSQKGSKYGSMVKDIIIKNNLE